MEISPEIRRIADTIRQAVPVEKIYLFGSHAYGTPHKDSDYDFFLVVPDGGMRPIEAMQEAQLAVAKSMRWRTTPIDILATTRSSFDEMKNLITLERVVDRKGIAL